MSAVPSANMVRFSTVFCTASGPVLNQVDIFLCVGGISAIKLVEKADGILFGDLRTDARRTWLNLNSLQMNVVQNW